MPDQRPTRKTYSEAMNEWASREGRSSFAERSRVSTLVPDPFAHPMVKVMGYLWRLGLIVMAGAGVYWVLFRLHLGSKEFADRLADQIKTAVNAETAQLTPLKWSGGEATARQFLATGGEGAFFRELAVSDLTFRVPFGRLWDQEWRLNRVTAGSVEVEFRSGGLHMRPAGDDDVMLDPMAEGFAPPVISAPGESLKLDPTAPDPALAPEAKGQDKRVLDLDLHRNGFSARPAVSRVLVGGIDASRFQAGWGTSDTTRGELRDASLWASRQSDGAWVIEVATGVLSQNWLRGMKVEGMRARLSGGVMVLEPTPVQIGSAAAVLTGEVRAGRVPDFNLTIQGENFALDAFCGEPFDRLFALQGNGTLKIGGSTNLASGITVDGSMQVTGGHIRGLAIQQALANATTRVRFREFEITGGTIGFSTGGGRLEVRSFNLVSRSDVVLRGQLVHEDNELMGDLEIGVDPILLQKLAPVVQERYFSRVDEGKHWMQVPLEGDPERLTSALAREFTAAHQAAAKQP